MLRNTNQKYKLKFKIFVRPKKEFYLCISFGFPEGFIHKKVLVINSFIVENCEKLPK